MRSLVCSPDLSVVALSGLYVAAFVLLLTPGILASAPLLRRKQLESHQVLLFAFGVAAACGYFIFWVYYLNDVAGKLVSFGALILLLTVYLDPYLRKVIVAILLAREVKIPLLLTFGLGIFYTAVSYIGYFDAKECAGENVTFILQRTVPGSPDYLIQRLWADRLYANMTPWNIVLDPDMARTTMADRPPVLGGIALLFFAMVPRSLEHLYFMAITTIASTSWIAALALVCREARLGLDRTTLFVLAVSQTFYFYFSSVFTWPKALSGALLVGAFALLVLRPAMLSRRVSGAQLALGSAFAGLAFLTHNSTLLLLVPVAALLLKPQLFPGVRSCAIGSGIFLLIALPYTALKSVKEPTASNLTKYTLTIPESAPVEPEENRNLSIPEALKKAYAPLSWSEIADNKWRNITPIFNPGCFGVCAGSTMKESNLHSEVLPVMGSMKFFNLGWLLFLPLAFLAPMLYGNSRQQANAGLEGVRKISSLCLAVAACGLLIYALISFQQRVNNISSSGFMMLLFLAAGLRLFALRWSLVALFFLCQFAYFQWIIWLNVVESHLQIVPLMALLYGLCALTILTAAFRLRPIGSNATPVAK